ncbi:MAG: UbiA prenyltransferase family protein [Alphaproteobacteria bacterium]|nr:UbiA prenyltransferase family protein [Alphaproteobacteria bacterium]
MISRDLLRLARPAHWVKNAAVVLPLVMAPGAIDAASIGASLAAAVAFCLASSAVYALNDVCDRDADRRHPAKRERPVASGAVLPRAALLLALGCAVAGVGLAFAVAPGAGLAALALLFVNLLYSLKLKHVAIVDALAIAAGFLLRILAGAAAIAVEPSPWILVMAGQLSLFLAFAKRRHDLVHGVNETHRPSLAGYNLPFLDAAIAMLLGGLLVAYVVYTTDHAVMARLGTRWMVATVPFVAAGILRYLQILYVEREAGSPVDVLLRDRFVQAAILGWLATYGLLVAA